MKEIMDGERRLYVFLHSELERFYVLLKEYQNLNQDEDVKLLTMIIERKEKEIELVEEFLKATRRKK